MFNRFTMKLQKPIKKWKPPLGGKTTGEPKAPFYYGVLGLLAVTAILFFPVLIGKSALFANDIVNLNLPQRHLIGEIWRTGQVPLWNPYSFGGQPLLSAMQAGALYPLNALFVLLPDIAALNMSYILHYFLAGLFVYLYVYAIRRDVVSAWLAGVIFMSSGFLMGHLIHTQMVNSAVWLPLVLYFLQKLRQTGRARYAIAAALTLAVQWLAGHPQISFFTYLLSGFYLLFFAWQERHSWKRTILQGALALAAGVLLAAAQLVPTVELISHSVRQSASFEFFVSGSMTKEWLGTLFVPFYHGGGYTDTPFKEETLFWEYVGYVGAAALAVALAAAVKGWRRPHAVFFALLTGIGLVLSVGEHTPLYRVLFHIPGFNLFRVPARYIFFVDLGCAVLIGLMLRDLLAVWTGRVLILAGMLPVGAAIWWIRTWWHPVNSFAWQVPVFALFAAIGVIVLFWKQPRWQFLALAAVLALDSVGYGTALASYTWRPIEKSAITPPAADFIKSQSGAYRAAAFEFSLGLDRGARYDIEMINGYDSLVTKNYAEQVDLGWAWGPLQRPRQTLDLLNVKYLVINQADASIKQHPVLNGPAPMRQVWANGQTAVLENPTAYPRYWLAPSAQRFTEKLPAEITETGKTYSEYQLRYQAPSAGFLMVSQLYYPGWKAYVDNKKTDVINAGGYLSGIPIAAGEHTVYFRYEPASWLWGLILSVLGLVLLGMWAFMARRKLML